MAELDAEHPRRPAAAPQHDQRNRIKASSSAVFHGCFFSANGSLAAAVELLELPQVFAGLARSGRWR